MSTLKKLESRPEVEEIIHESNYWADNRWAKGYWVELNYGYCFEEKGSHCFWEKTLREVKESLSLVTNCDCNTCKNHQ
jgi:hypothetical protein